MMADGVPLREFLEGHLRHLEERLALQGQAHMEIHRLAEAALTRRLDTMSTMLERSERERGQYVLAATLDARMIAATVEYHDLAKSNQGRIAALEAQAQNWAGRLWAFGAILTFGVTAVALAVKLL